MPLNVTIEQRLESVHSSKHRQEEASMGIESPTFKLLKDESNDYETTQAAISVDYVSKLMLNHNSRTDNFTPRAFQSSGIDQPSDFIGDSKMDIFISM